MSSQRRGRSTASGCVSAFLRCRRVQNGGRHPGDWCASMQSRVEAKGPTALEAGNRDERWPGSRIQMGIERQPHPPAAVCGTRFRVVIWQGDHRRGRPASMSSATAAATSSQPRLRAPGGCGEAAVHCAMEAVRQRPLWEKPRNPSRSGQGIGNIGASSVSRRASGLALKKRRSVFYGRGGR